MQKKISLKTAAYLGGAFVLGLCMLLTFIIPEGSTRVQSALGAGNQNTTFSALSDSTEVLVSASASTLVLATSSSRSYAIIGNNSGASTIFLSLTGGGAASVNKGIALRPGEKYEIRDVNLYTGAIYAFASSTAASTTVAARQ